MQNYNAPLRDMRFVLHELHDSSSLNHLPGLEEITPDLLDTILDEAAKFMSAVLLPLNASGDAEGCRLDNGVVHTPKGFKDAYRQFAEAGWTALNCDPAYGGQGLPESVSKLIEEIICGCNLSFGLYPGLSHGAYMALRSHGSDALKDQYLPKLVDGSWGGTMCLTEAQCGTDLGMLRTKAVPQADGSYKISGSKIFISSGEHDLTENIVHLVLARLPDAPCGHQGHQPVRRTEVPAAGRRLAGSAQRRALHRHRAQDGNPRLGDLPAELRRCNRLARRRTEQGHARDVRHDEQ